MQFSMHMSHTPNIFEAYALIKRVRSTVQANSNMPLYLVYFEETEMLVLNFRF